MKHDKDNFSQLKLYQNNISSTHMAAVNCESVSAARSGLSANAILKTDRNFFKRLNTNVSSKLKVLFLLLQ